jgi:hypothetical protein
VIDLTSKVLEVDVNPKARGTLIKVRGELPLEFLSMIRRREVIKVPLEKLRSVDKYRVRKGSADILKCVEAEEAQYNLAVVEIPYEGGEIRLIMSDNEATRLGKVFDKIFK